MKRLYGGKMVEWDPEPDDEKTWWQRSHCGPGSLDEDDLCICDRSHRDCARACTQHIKNNDKDYCMGSGFWCPSCGIFYPQDSCGETCDDEFESLHGKRLTRDGNKVYCNCGEYLFKAMEEEE